MIKQIPVLDCCTLSGYKEDELLVDHLANYLHQHSSLAFPHRHNFYHLVLFTSGSGTHSIDFTRFEVRPMHIYFMVPGQIHTWEFEGNPDGYVINFSREFFQSLLLRPDFLNGFTFLNGIAQDGAFQIPAHLEAEMTAFFERIYEQVNREKPLQKDLVSVMLLYVFMRMEQQLSPAEKHKFPVYNYTLLRNFQKLIEQHFTNLRLPKDYADLLYITPNHLNALCKEYLGMQAGEVIRNRILLEAKRLLVSQDMTISEISDELSFNDNSYFTKFFKKLVGMTPEEFRKNKA
ncbi:AraC family transcriptional regulator [Pedobacter sp. FW305-3-2-15-E-R2A2]|jgi:AraC-like DNA-binding protein|uniref:helix-turn-helix domain-containing protein n=1 Tax=Pedobacter sp. FW305-3-2-15-E-R2A2 TaxID=3140251 RepID=UPI0031406B8B